MKISFVLICAFLWHGLLLPAAEPAYVEVGSIPVGSVLPQIVQGGAWETELQVVNTDKSRPVPYTISFFSNGGVPMNVRILDGDGRSLGTTNIIAGVVAYPGVDFYTLPAGGKQNAGYAVIESSDFRSALINAVLTQHVPGRPDFQASVPSMDRTEDLLRIPFKNRRPYTTTLAIANSFSRSKLDVIARNTKGLELCRASFLMDEGDHMAIVLSDTLPCTINQDGLLEVIADRFGVTAVAFLFNDFGAFTTQLPFDVFCP